MGKLSVGEIIFVPFPFSNLAKSKLRPAVVLANADNDDWILCQITSNPYFDPSAIELTDESFSQGGLHQISYARPGKLFTGNSQLAVKKAGLLNKESLKKIINSVIALLKTD